MLCPPLPPSPLVEGWIARHRGATTFLLHMLGIPPTIIGVLFLPIYVVLVSIPLFLLALGLFVGGYLLQFLGHLLEGTDPGEIIFFKKKLGMSYQEVPRAERRRRAVSAGAMVADATGGGIRGKSGGAGVPLGGPDVAARGDESAPSFGLVGGPGNP